MEYAIQVENLSKTYGDVRAVQDLSFAVKRGTVFGLLGANGAGKSTTLECILGTRRPDGGRARILGMDPRAERRRLFERVGVQFQEASYQEKITVHELCEVTASLYRHAADSSALLSSFGLSEKAKSSVSELSGGQRQRLFIVLALLPRPEVVFLDELTTGLDARARRDILKRLTDLKAKGLTVLLTSHSMDEVEALCERICILKRGRAVFMGTVAEAVAASPCAGFEDAYLWFTEEEKTDEDVLHDA